MNNGTERVKARRTSALDRRQRELDDLKNDRSTYLADHVTRHSNESKEDVRQRKMKAAAADIANLEAKLGYR